MINGKIVKRADVSREFFNATAIELETPIEVACDRKIGTLVKEHRHTTSLLVFSRGAVGTAQANAVFVMCTNHAPEQAHYLPDFAVQVGTMSLTEACESIGVRIVK